MAYLGVGQIALLVDDFEAAVNDFHEVFGIEFITFEHPQLRQMIAVSDAGIVLTSKIDPSDTSPIESNWTGRLTAIELKVTDIEETRAAMEARGAKTMYYLDTPGTLKEYYMYSEGFHGIPLTIFQNESESWLESFGNPDDAATDSESGEAPGGIKWINQPSYMDPLNFEGRTAVVTGAGGNPSLGRAHAMLFAARGANVVVNDIGRDPELKGYTGVASAQAVVDEITAAGGTAVADTNSIATEAGATALVQTAIDAFGTVDVLVNNAGISYSADFDEITSRDFQRHIDINLMGTAWCCRAVWPHMRAAGYGRIVNISSGALAGLGRLSAYAASKGGVFSLTRALAVDGEPLGIKVNTVNPAAHTRMLESQQQEDSALLVMAKESQPAELVSPVVAYLAHETCPVSGECISAVGGYVNRLYLMETAGFVDPELTPERLVERWDEAMNESDVRPVPAGFIDVSQWSPKPYEP